MSGRKFYELTTSERVTQLANDGVLSKEDVHLLEPCAALPADIATNMVENQIGVFPVPFGVAENFVVDGQPVLVPMAVEEPSVIAAASNAAKRCRSTGGFVTSSVRNGVVGQIVFSGHMDAAQSFLEQHMEHIRTVAHQAHPSLQTHGGGLSDARALTYSSDGEEYTEFRLTINPAQAMGANVVNTVSEAVAHYLADELPEMDLLMAILSNEAPGQTARAQAKFPFSALATASMGGQTVARRIVSAYRFAQCSPARAATNNKGIMNGINALVLATGNDTRNIAAAAYSSLTDSKRTWASWSLEEDCLVGSIEIPLPIGAVGGAISTLPMAKLAMRLLGSPDAERLMGIMASLGLASNLAAMRALVTQGIQSGHMNLQFRSLAIMAGAQEHEIEQVAAELRAQPSVAGLDRARTLLANVRAAR